MLKTYAVIGDPIDHSLSPTIHNAAYRELEMECTYIAYRVIQGDLATGIESLKKIKISGFNVTIPHKIEMMRYLDDVDENCKKIGAVNTVLNDDGILRGFNTDMDGFLEPIKRKEIKIKNSKILLLGAGGAARAIVTGFQKEGANEIIIANRTKENGDKLTEPDKSQYRATEVEKHSDDEVPSIAIIPFDNKGCLLYTSPSPRDQRGSRMPGCG